MFRRIVTVLEVVLLSYIIALIMVMSTTHGPSIARVDELNWVSMLGTIVGAVGALAGIVVAAFSLVSLFQIRRSVRLEFDDKYQQHKAELDQQSSEWATGIKFWTQATMSSDLTSAEYYMEQAIQAWHTAPGARTEMVQKFLCATESAFVLDLIPGQRESKESMPSIRTALDTDLVKPSKNFLHKCIQWWTIANECEQSGYGTMLNYYGSKIFGMSADTEGMFRYLDAWIESENNIAVSDTDLLIWASAIRNDTDWEHLQRTLVPTVYQSIELNISDIVSSFHKNNHNGMPQYHLVLPRRFNHVDSRYSIIGLSFVGSTWTVSNLMENNEERLKKYDSEADFVNYIASKFRIISSISIVH